MLNVLKHSATSTIFKIRLHIQTASLWHRCREFINPIGSNLIPDNKGMRFNPCHIALPGCRPGPGACTKSGRSLGKGSPDLSSAAVVPCVFGDDFQVLFSPALKLPKHKKLRQQMAMNTNLLSICPGLILRTLNMSTSPSPHLWIMLA